MVAIPSPSLNRQANKTHNMTLRSEAKHNKLIGDDAEDGLTTSPLSNTNYGKLGSNGTIPAPVGQSLSGGIDRTVSKDDDEGDESFDLNGKNSAARNLFPSQSLSKETHKDDEFGHKVAQGALNFLNSYASSTAAKLEDQAGQNLQLKTSLREANTNRLDLEAKLEQSQMNTATLEAQLKLLEDEVEGIKSERKQDKAQLAEAHNLIEALQNDVDGKTFTIQEYKHDISALDEDNATLKCKVDTLQGEKNRLLEEKNNLLDNLLEEKKRLSALEDINDQLNQDVRVRQDYIENLFRTRQP